jgi:hypothetical protein
MNAVKTLALSLLLFFIVISCSKTINWELYSNPEYGYEVLLPKKPIERKKTGKSEFGVLKVYVASSPAAYEGELGDNGLYMVSQTLYPKDSVDFEKAEVMDSFFENIINGVVQKINGTLVSKKAIILHSFPGREVKFSFKKEGLEGDHLIRLRLYLIDNALYLLQTITAVEKDDNQDIGKFMDSFKLITKK